MCSRLSSQRRAPSWLRLGRTTMSTGVHGPTRARIEEKTLRTDRWWLYPVTTFVVFIAFIVYATIRAFMGSALLLRRPTSRRSTRRACGDCVEGSSDFGQPFGWWPLSPALLILIFPLGFRLTCYYYRKAYYRVVLAVPAGLRRRRAAQEVHRRDPVPADPPEHPPLLLLRRGALRADPDLRPVLTFRDARRPLGPHGPRHAGLPGQRRADLALHALVPLLPPHHRRPAAPLQQASDPLPGSGRSSPSSTHHHARSPG